MCVRACVRVGGGGGRAVEAKIPTRVKVKQLQKRMYMFSAFSFDVPPFFPSVSLFTFYAVTFFCL